MSVLLLDEMKNYFYLSKST